MPVSHLHTPRINNVSVFDSKVNATLSTFLLNSDDGIMFVPATKYTESSIITLPNNRHNKIIGAGRKRDLLYSFADAGAVPNECGFTQIILTGSYMAFEGAADAGFYNALTLRDLQVSGVDLTQNQRIVDMSIGAPEYVELNNVGLDTYDSVENTGGVLDADGVGKVILDNIDIYGFGESSSANERYLIYVTGSDYFSMNNVFINGDTGNTYPSATVRIGGTPFTSINNLYIDYMGNTNKITMVLQFDPVATTIYKARCTVKNLFLNDIDFTSSQVGLFSFSDTRVELELSGVYTEIATTSNKIRASAPAGTPCLRVIGDVCGTTASNRIPYGRVAIPFDTAYNLITPTTYGTSASAPVASTNYVCELRNANLLVYGGAGVSITISGNSEYYATSGFTYKLNVGETMSFGPFSTAPTVSVWFDR